MSTISEITEGMAGLIEYIRQLDKSKRHRLTILCRGTEPWEIEAHMVNERIRLKKQQTLK